MFEIITNWFIQNYIEIIAAVLGIISVYFAIKEKPIFWILSFANAALFVFVYFNQKIYALMILQFYFIFLSIYGFYYWIKGGKKDDKQDKVPIIHIPKKFVLVGSILFLIIYFSIAAILIKFTDSQIPFVDSFITTCSIFASYMMTKKYIEHWFIWFINDIVAIITFISQDMFATMVLYFVFLSTTFIGFFRWRKEFLMQKNN